MSWKTTYKSSMSNQTTHYGILGGLVNRQISGRSSMNRVTSRLVIPTDAYHGLKYMQINNLLSKNPACSGGVGQIKRLTYCNGGSPSIARTIGVDEDNAEVISQMDPQVNNVINNQLMSEGKSPIDFTKSTKIHDASDLLKWLESDASGSAIVTRNITIGKALTSATRNPNLQLIIPAFRKVTIIIQDNPSQQLSSLITNLIIKPGGKLYIIGAGLVTQPSGYVIGNANDKTTIMNHGTIDIDMDKLKINTQTPFKLVAIYNTQITNYNKINVSNITQSIFVAQSPASSYIAGILSGSSAPYPPTPKGWSCVNGDCSKNCTLGDASCKASLADCTGFCGRWKCDASVCIQCTPSDLDCSYQTQAACTSACNPAPTLNGWSCVNGDCSKNCNLDWGASCKATLVDCTGFCGRWKCDVSVCAPCDAQSVAADCSYLTQAACTTACNPAPTLNGWSCVNGDCSKNCTVTSGDASCKASLADCTGFCGRWKCDVSVCSLCTPSDTDCSYQTQAACNTACNPAPTLNGWSCVNGDCSKNCTVTPGDASCKASLTDCTGFCGRWKCDVSVCSLCTPSDLDCSYLNQAACTTACNPAPTFDGWSCVNGDCSKNCTQTTGDASCKATLADCTGFCGRWKCDASVCASCDAQSVAADCSYLTQAACTTACNPAPTFDGWSCVNGDCSKNCTQTTGDASCKATLADCTGFCGRWKCDVSVCAPCDAQSVAADCSYQTQAACTTACNPAPTFDGWSCVNGDCSKNCTQTTGDTSCKASLIDCTGFCGRWKCDVSVCAPCDAQSVAADCSYQTQAACTTACNPAPTFNGWSCVNGDCSKNCTQGDASCKASLTDCTAFCGRYKCDVSLCALCDAQSVAADCSYLTQAACTTACNPSPTTGYTCYYDRSVNPNKYVCVSGCDLLKDPKCGADPSCNNMCNKWKCLNNTCYSCNTKDEVHACSYTNNVCNNACASVPTTGYSCIAGYFGATCTSGCNLVDADCVTHPSCYGLCSKFKCNASSVCVGCNANDPSSECYSPGATGCSAFCGLYQCLSGSCEKCSSPQDTCTMSQAQCTTACAAAKYKCHSTNHTCVSDPSGVSITDCKSICTPFYSPQEYSSDIIMNNALQLISLGIFAPVININNITNKDAPATLIAVSVPRIVQATAAWAGTINIDSCVVSGTSGGAVALCVNTINIKKLNMRKCSMNTSGMITKTYKMAGMSTQACWIDEINITNSKDITGAPTYYDSSGICIFASLVSIYNAKLNVNKLNMNNLYNNSLTSAASTIMKLSGATLMTSNLNILNIKNVITIDNDYQKSPELNPQITTSVLNISNLSNNAIGINNVNNIKINTRLTMNNITNSNSSGIVISPSDPNGVLNIIKDKLFGPLHIHIKNCDNAFNYISSSNNSTADIVFYVDSDSDAKKIVISLHKGSSTAAMFRNISKIDAMFDASLNNTTIDYNISENLFNQYKCTYLPPRQSCIYSCTTNKCKWLSNVDNFSIVMDANKINHNPLLL